jgi:hypothetical protein
LVVQSAQNWHRQRVTGSLNGQEFESLPGKLSLQI